MKNDIDAILDSMFRGGRLHFKSSQPGEKERGEKPRTAPPAQAPIEAAAAHAQPGDIVSLSPACAAFDLYPNFEVRGRHYKELVNGLQ